MGESSTFLNLSKWFFSDALYQGCIYNKKYNCNVQELQFFDMGKNDHNVLSLWCYRAALSQI